MKGVEKGEKAFLEPTRRSEVMEHGKVAKCCAMLVAMDAQEATLEQEQESPVKTLSRKGPA